MKYIVITSKHHDGFAMFDSKASDWNIVKATPFGRDPLKELAAACRKYGIKLGFYYSQAQDWNNGGSACNGKWDPAQKHDMDDYIDQVAVPQVKEILSNYGEFPAVLWWDTPCDMTPERAAKLNALLKLKPGIIQNNRLGGGFGGDTETPEQQIPVTGFKNRDWETCMTMNDTWGYKSTDQNWKSPQTLVRNLIDIASKGGNYLLNVGPTAEGLIPTPSLVRLREVGEWMKVNGDAIYGTQASPFRKLSFDGRCTRKPGTLYLHVFERPAEGKIVLPIANAVRKAYLLRDPAKSCAVAGNDQGKMITLPDYAADPIATVVVAEIEGEPQLLTIADSPIRQAGDGSFTLNVTDAEIEGSSAKLETRDGVPNVGYWTDAGDKVQWKVNITQPGKFMVEMTLACDPDSNGCEFNIIAGKEKLTGKIEATKSWSDFVTVKVGSLNLAKAGPTVIVIQPTKKPGAAVMNLRSLVLRPSAP
jgi:alpha-L-fucosidase